MGRKIRASKHQRLTADGTRNFKVRWRVAINGSKRQFSTTFTSRQEAESFLRTCLATNGADRSLAYLKNTSPFTPKEFRVIGSELIAMSRSTASAHRSHSPHISRNLSRFRRRRPWRLRTSGAACTGAVFGVSDTVLFLPRRQVDSYFHRREVPTIQQRRFLLPQHGAAGDDFLPCSEVARLLQIPCNLVTAWAESGRVPCRWSHYGTKLRRRHMRVRLMDVRDVRDARGQPPRNPDPTALQYALQIGRRTRGNFGPA
jgi:hypothetical protein